MAVDSSNVQFNSYKHHLGFVASELIKVAKESGKVREEISARIKLINANFVDVYTGRLIPEDIKRAVSMLIQQKITDRAGYVAWLGEKKYRTVTLNDHSGWVLRESEYSDAFIHIHPARKPPLTVRVHGNAWKTVVGLMLYRPDYLHCQPDIPAINAFRKNELSLSPVKGPENLQRILRVFQLIHSALNFPM